MATWQPFEPSESHEPTEVFQPFGPSGPLVPAKAIEPERAIPERPGPAFDDQSRTLDGQFTLESDIVADVRHFTDAPTEQFSPDFDDDVDYEHGHVPEPSLMDRLGAMDSSQEGADTSVNPERRKRFAMIAGLAAVAVCAGVLAGYVAVQAAGGWSATWMGDREQPVGAPPESSSAPAPGEAQRRQSSPSVSPSEQASASPSPSSEADPVEPTSGPRPTPKPTPPHTSDPEPSEPSPSPTPPTSSDQTTEPQNPSRPEGAG